MQLCDLTLQYDGVRVLEHLNLTLPDSGLVCIFAPSGTGKTTLLNLFCGLLKPDSGRIEGLEDRKFAYVFQEDRLVPQLTARENIRLVMEQPDDQWICQMMEQLGLAGWEDALPQELSGGMQRRVAIARVGRRDGQGGGCHLFAEQDAQSRKGTGGTQPAGAVGPGCLPSGDGKDCCLCTQASRSKRCLDARVSCTDDSNLIFPHIIFHRLLLLNDIL